MIEENNSRGYQKEIEMFYVDIQSFHSFIVCLLFILLEFF